MHHQELKNSVENSLIITSSTIYSTLKVVHSKLLVRVLHSDCLWFRWCGVSLAIPICIHVFSQNISLGNKSDYYHHKLPEITWIHSGITPNQLQWCLNEPLWLYCSHNIYGNGRNWELYFVKWTHTSQLIWGGKKTML